MANSSTTCSTSSNSTGICSESNYSAPPPNFYLDEWKLSKKLEGSSSRIRRCSSSIGSHLHHVMKNSSSSSRQKRCAFARKCARLVKEQRARFYIMRRCVIMLICWRDYNDS